MKVKIECEVKPFSVPNFVILENILNEDPTGIPLSALDEYTLEEMCDDFRAAVFKNAGKSRPPRPG